MIGPTTCGHCAEGLTPTESVFGVCLLCQIASALKAGFSQCERGSHA